MKHLLFLNLFSIHNFVFIISLMDGRTPFLIKLAKLTYARLLCRGGQVKLENPLNIDLKTTPYLYLSNHVGIMDPVMISAVMPRHIRWVAGAYLFKTRFLKLVLGAWCTAIPKQQGRGDLSMLRTVKKALEDGDNVGLFPEGTRTWDGEMVELDFKALAKMVRFLKAPVVIINLEGGFAKQPRWADKPRKGKVTVRVVHLISKEEVKSASVEELKDRLQKHLAFSNDKWKRRENYTYASPGRAEGLQRLLYLCPRCNAIDSMVTSGDTIKCTACGAEATLDQMDNIQSSTTEFKTLPQWHRWEAGQIGKAEGFPEEKGVLLQKGNADNNGELETISEDITVCLKDGAIVVRDNTAATGNEIILPLSSISSLILNAKQTMELFCGEALYRIRLLPNSSSLKYHEYYQERK